MRFCLIFIMLTNFLFSLKKFLAERMIRRSLKERALPLNDLESKHSNPDEDLFNDSSYFLGRGEDGSHFVVRLAFRNGRSPEYWLSFFIHGKGAFELRDLELIEGDGFKLGALEYTCLEPGKTWKITYKGSINQGDNVQKLDLDLCFEGTRPLVNFKNITNPSDTAIAIAKEPWSASFLKRLKEIKKVHLEQGGQITGSIILDGEEIQVNWKSIRDHSWGTRSWETWKRHVWMGGVLDNGEAFNLSLITYDFMGQLSAGYLSQGEDLIYFKALPDMETFASDPLIPREVSIEFFDREGKTHLLKMTMAHHFDFMMDGAYFIREGMGNFELDGVPGMGVAEFGLNPSIYDTTTI